MAHQTIVLQQILSQMPWARFNALVNQHQADKHVRTLTSRTMLITLLYALRIPVQGGQIFRSDRGHCSELMAATIPI